MAGSEISYFHRDDIAAMIKSIVQAGDAHDQVIRQEIERIAQKSGAIVEDTQIDQRVELYNRGRRDALGALAVAFGILPKQE